MKYVICLLMLAVTARAQENNFGIYSNIRAANGHFDGMEIFYTPNKLLFQMAEGWPHNPILLDIRNISNNKYSAVHPEMGKMQLSFSEQQVEINFSDISYIQILNKGKSFWQR